MTLLLAAANVDQIVMLADRRLTSAGAVVEEDAGKLCEFVLGGARFAVGFTGIGRAGGFDMRRWLLDALWDSAEPGLIKSYPTLVRFAERASRDFATLPALRSLRPADRRTEFVFAGYLNHPEHSVMSTALVSNFRDWTRGVVALTSWNQFALSMAREPLPRVAAHSYVEWAGARRAITGRNVDELHDLLQQRKPPKAIIGKATDVMIEAAGRPEAAGTVGTRIVWVRIPPDPREPSESGYCSAAPTYDSYVPDLVTRTPGGSGGVAFVSLGSAERDKPPSMNVPRVHRNALCPCKSGERYKNCHGRRWRPRGPKTP